MKDSMSQEQRQELVLRFLYGDLNHAEKSGFEQQLENDAELRRLLEDEQQFQQMLPRGTAPRVDSERLLGNRYLLRKNLRGSQLAKFNFGEWLLALTRKPGVLAVQFGGMAAAFVLGLMVTGQSGLPFNRVTESFRLSSPLALVSEEDYQVAQLRINSYDEASGAIDLTFSLVSDSTVQANINDAGVRKLMTTALQDDVDSAVRLQTVSALAPVNQQRDVYRTLIYLLTSDQNPGVRYEVVSLLVELAEEEEVRAALRLALQQDVNSGVRLEAFNALASFRDEKTLAVFRESMTRDNNEYIRMSARSIVENPQYEPDQIEL
jgi:hypothetical protein